jgi:hypothetical protein
MRVAGVIKVPGVVGLIESCKAPNVSVVDLAVSSRPPVPYRLVVSPVPVGVTVVVGRVWRVSPV